VWESTENERKRIKDGSIERIAQMYNVERVEIMVTSGWIVKYKQVRFLRNGERVLAGC